MHVAKWTLLFLTALKESDHLKQGPFVQGAGFLIDWDGRYGGKTLKLQNKTKQNSYT